MFRRTDDLRVLDQEWQDKDDEAKETTFSLDDWSDRQTGRWDLDEPHREPTGEDNPRTYEGEKPLQRQNADPDSPRVFDVRDHPRIRDGPSEEEDDW